MTRAEFNAAVDNYCQHFGASLTSGRRTPARNAVVKGVSTSPHLVGLGADVVPDDAPAPARAVEVARRLGLRLIIERDHHHLQPLDWGPG